MSLPFFTSLARLFQLIARVQINMVSGSDLGGAYLYQNMKMADIVHAQNAQSCNLASRINVSVLSYYYSI